MSHNRLGVFPDCVCEIFTLTELNLSCNNLKTVPAKIGNLQRCGEATRACTSCMHLVHCVKNTHHMLLVSSKEISFILVLLLHFHDITHL